MASALKTLFNHITRVEALTPTHQIYGEYVKRIQLKYGYHDDHVMAVYLSHHRALELALQYCRQNSQPFALIMEDDVSFDFTLFWSGAFDSYLTKLPANWATIQLGYTRGKIDPLNGHVPRYEVPVRPGFYKGSHYGAFAYLINTNGLELILNRSMDTVKAGCEYMTSDDCLLPFAPSLNIRRAHPLSDRNYFIAPPLFGVNIDATPSHRKGHDKEYSLQFATAAQCTSIFDNVRLFNQELKGNNLRRFVDEGNST